MCFQAAFVLGDMGFVLVVCRSGIDARQTLIHWWCPKKYADIKRQANNDISIVQNFLLKQRNLANLNY